MATYIYESGMIMIFDDACPSGWTRMSSWDDRFIRGASSEGGTGGTSTHLHSVNPASKETQSQDGSVPIDVEIEYDNKVSEGYHSHSYDRAASNTDTADHTPPWVGVVFCKKD